MKKAFVFLLSVVMAGLCLLTGCGGKDSDALTIKYFTGGFGSAWLQSAKEKFIAKNPGVKIVLEPEESLRETAATYLKSGRNVPDIMMSQSLGWADFVTRGYIEPLDDVFESEVKTGVKLKDYLSEDFKEFPYMQRIPNQGEEHPWVIPWSTLNCGIIYNETMLLSTPRRAAGGNWTAPPETTDELLEYEGDVKAKDDKVVPFAWSGGAINWLTFPMYTWWAQIQGVETPNIDGEGTWYDFWDFDAPDYKNADVYKQTGIWQSLDVLRSLIVKEKTDSTGGDWANSPNKVNGSTNIDAEKLFINSGAAMIFCGSWLENEMRDFLPDGFKMKIMQTPAAPGAQINPETGKPYLINNTNAGDVMFIPREAPHKELAKEFLKFISTEEMMMDFTRHTKMVRPYKYNPLELDPDYAWGDFAKSCFEVYNNADYNLYEYSKNKSFIYTYKRPELFQEVTMATALNGLKKMTGKQIMIDGTPDYKSVYQLVSVEYPKWKEEIGI